MAKLYTEMTAEELKAEQKALESRYDAFKAKNLKLDMSRGKPGADQLDLSSDMNDVKDYISDGVDIRNYGIMDGIPSCKKLNSFALFRVMIAILQFLSISVLK